MQFSTPTLVAFMAAMASATPLSAREDKPQTAHFKFHAVGDGTYDLDVLTDGATQLTNEDAKVTKVDINDYNAQQNCIFKDSGDKEIEGELKIDNETGGQALEFGGEDGVVIKSVSCEGVCLTTYADCYDPSAGMSLGSCCAGFCAANKCRPWNTGN